jgi:hypothetical protein
VKVIFGGNWNVVNTGNPSSNTLITPPFVAEVGPSGTATSGIDLANNKLTGRPKNCECRLCLGS